MTTAAMARTRTISMSVKPRGRLVVLTAEIIGGAFHAIRALAEDFEIAGYFLARETVAVIVAPRIRREFLHDLRPAARNRRAGRFFHQCLETLLGGRECAGVQLVHRQGAFEALEVG